MTATEHYLDLLDPAVDWVRWPILPRDDEDVASLDYVYALPSTAIVPHWHLVTEGLEARELGMELTLRVPRAPEDQEPPEWAIRLLVTMGNSMREGGPVSPGDTQHLDFPVSTTEILPAACFLEDVEHVSVTTPEGEIAFVQLFGLTRDEIDLLTLWSAIDFVEELRKEDGALLTDPRRRCTLEDPERRAMFEARVREGTSHRRIVRADAVFGRRGALFGVYVSISTAEVIVRELLPRVRYGGGGCLETPTGAVVVFEHAAASRWDFDPEAGVALWLTEDDAQTLEDEMVGAGSYVLPSLNGFEIGVSEDASFATLRDRKPVLRPH